MLRVTLSNMAWINREDLSEEKIQRLKKVLTVRQEATSVHSVPSWIETYKEDAVLNRLGVPLFFYMKTKPFDDNLTIQLSNGDPVISDMVFKGSLRTGQLPPYKAFVDKMKDPMFFGGIISLPCGEGKTVLAIKLISEIKKKTLVIVHKEFLVGQWKERINEFMPTVKVGKIQRDECDIVDKDIVIGMVHSLASRGYDGIYSRFGVVVSDETHRMSAETFSEAAPRFNSRYRIGLTATARRKDGTERIFFNTYGDIIYQGCMEKIDVGIRRVRTPFKLRMMSKYDPTKVSDERVVTLMSRNGERNAVIGKEIFQACEKDRKCLILSDRLEHLELLTVKLRELMREKSMTRSIDYYIGGRKEDELKLAARAQVIMATFAMAAEGLDISDLDTLFLATPKSDVEQSVGRILRKVVDKRRPIVVEFIDERDNFSMRRWKNRERYYREQGWI
ncbi:MAG: DEAD/DEAH box helicase family protein [Nitrospirae bacterium]|nr:DEAD/DEAH box helicase family protein [Nitrospirota bacterium]